MIEGRGTPETDWLPFLADLPELALEPLPARALVVAPHPDDEVLGVGGLIAALADSGVPVTVICVTDGEASHPGGSVEPGDLAAMRTAETASAVATLSPDVQVRHLHLPDGGRDTLVAPLLAAVHTEPSYWLLAPWTGDGHPDHEAVGRACEAIAERDGARLLTYPVWAWHWAHPPAPELPWGRAHRFNLSPGGRAVKSQALSAFVSQIAPLGPLPEDEPVLPAWVLERFRRPFEVVFA